MGIIRLYNNLRYLFRYDLKQLYKSTLKMERAEHVLPAALSYLDRLYKTDPNVFRPAMASADETMHELQTTQKSFIRLGDGEFILAAGGRDIIFQKADTKLQERLLEILDCEDDRIMLGITSAFWYRVRPIRNEWDWEMEEYAPARIVADKHLKQEKMYYDAEVSLTYGLRALEHSNIEHTSEWYDKWRSIWAGKKVAVVCGKSIFDKIENNIFDNAGSIQYIYTPSVDAFASYDSIYEQVRKIDKETLICLIVGPTAKVLAYDLTVKDGFRCLDVGHLAKDYDCWKRQLPREHEIMMHFFGID